MAKNVFIWLIWNFIFNVLGKEFLKPDAERLFWIYGKDRNTTYLLFSCILPLAQVANIYQCIMVGLANDFSGYMIPFFPSQFVSKNKEIPKYLELDKVNTSCKKGCLFFFSFWTRNN